MSRQSRRNRGGDRRDEERTTEVPIRSESAAGTGRRGRITGTPGGSASSPSRTGGTAGVRGGAATNPNLHPGHGVPRRAQEVMPSLQNVGWMSPAQMMRALSRDMSRMVDRWAPGRVGAFMGWPAVEMFDRDGEFVVRAELPGLTSDDVHVRVAGDSLLIEGERRNEREERREGYFESEWTYGHFSRRIPLPAHIDPDAVRASFRDGVLEVSMRLNRPVGRDVPIDAGTGEMRQG